jgi:hypothetical protein
MHGVNSIASSDLAGRFGATNGKDRLLSAAGLFDRRDQVLRSTHGGRVVRRATRNRKAL